MAFVTKWFSEQANVVRQVGGLSNAFRRLLRECNVRVGTIVGTDEYGNKYYENNTYVYGRNRFVEYPYVNRHAFDGTQIPAEWHGWMHYMTDVPPTKAPPPDRKFYLPHEVNHSGSDKRYVPYSTTKQKIHGWEPKTGL